MGAVIDFFKLNSNIYTLTMVPFDGDIIIITGIFQFLNHGNFFNELLYILSNS